MGVRLCPGACDRDGGRLRLRLLVTTWGNATDWTEALRRSPDRPRLPYPYATGAAFLGEGHSVAGLDLCSPTALSARPPFDVVFGRHDAGEAHRATDAALMTIGDLASLCRRARGLGRLWRRTIVFSFLWDLRSLPWSHWPLGLATRVLTRAARGIVFLVEEQRRAARSALPASVFVERMTWGVDTAFYREPVDAAHVPPAARAEVERLVAAPYVVLAGDQLRRDADVVALAEGGVRVARVPQSASAARWLRAETDRRGLGDRLFVFEKATYPLLRYLIRHAKAHVGLVDASWQPAGWTVACESLAAGLPALVYEGLVSRELGRLGAGRLVTPLRPGAVEDVVAAVARLPDAPPPALAEEAREFARTALDLEVVGAAFARRIAAHWTPRT